MGLRVYGLVGNQGLRPTWASSLDSAPHCRAASSSSAITGAAFVLAAGRLSPAAEASFVLGGLARLAALLAFRGWAEPPAGSCTAATPSQVWVAKGVLWAQGEDEVPALPSSLPSIRAARMHTHDLSQACQYHRWQGQPTASCAPHSCRHVCQHRAAAAQGRAHPAGGLPGGCWCRRASYRWGACGARPARLGLLQQVLQALLARLVQLIHNLHPLCQRLRLLMQRQGLRIHTRRAPPDV